MNDLFKAITKNDLVGENGMVTHSTSGSFLVDMFFKMGASRNKSASELIQMFERSFAEDQKLTLRMIFYNRDIRGGQGERYTFRVFFRYLSLRYPEIAEKYIQFVPEYGRFDDLLYCCYNTPIWEQVADFLLHSLKTNNKLCGKWMPREGKSLHFIAESLMKLWDLTPRKYRLLLSGNTEVVESLMCKNKWEEINYNHVPSQAIKRYRNAFKKHDENRFVEWIESLSKPESGNKINAGAIFPHEIVNTILKEEGWKFVVDASKSEIELANAQWDALPNYIPEGLNFLPVCDVSGSMQGLPIMVCVALGIYLSERNNSEFKNGFITFSQEPTLQYLQGTLVQRITQLATAHWQQTTDIQKVFELILNKAHKSGISQSQMPNCVIILSDMQFNAATRDYGNKNRNIFKLLKRMYKDSGYELPKLIFWNLRDSVGVPVKNDEDNTILVSGFSPSIMQFVMSGGNPLELVMHILNSKRYQIN